MRKEKRMRFKVNMNKASQGIHLLSHNVAAIMGLIKLMEEIGASEQICEGGWNQTHQDHTPRACTSLQCDDCKDNVSIHVTKSEETGSFGKLWCDSTNSRANWVMCSDKFLLETRNRSESVLICKSWRRHHKKKNMFYQLLMTFCLNLQVPKYFFC